MEGLSGELLIQVFSYLEPVDFYQVANACKRWYNVLIDEQLWKAAFLNKWTVEPINRLASSWQQEYFRRLRCLCQWTRGHQLALYKFREIGDIDDARISYDSRSLILSSKECIIHAAFASNSKLKRSLQYYSRTFGEDICASTVSFSPGGKMAVGLDDGSLVIYEKIPSGSLVGPFQIYKSPIPRSNGNALPVQKIKWESESQITLLCRHGHFPSCRLIWWDLDKNIIKKSIDKFHINCWMIYKEELYWSSAGSFGSSLWIQNYPWDTIDFSMELADCLLLASKSKSTLILIDPSNGIIKRKIELDDSNSPVCNLIRSIDGFQIFISTQSDRIYQLTAFACDQALLKITNVTSKGPLPTRILDMQFDRVKLFVLLADSLLIYDMVNFELVKSIAIPGKLRKAHGADLDVDGLVQGKFIYLDEKGRMIVRWGNRNIHFWNFGPRQGYLEGQQRRSSADKAPSKPTREEIRFNLKDDLDAYDDEQKELTEKRRIEMKYSLEGMNEAEMLQLAQLMSLEQNSQSSHHNHKGLIEFDYYSNRDDDGGRDEEVDSDFELRMALGLSLSEAQQ